ncbi:hypothetical protein IW262DRAFT_1302065 [Armillaria fumosa]|nr:hypothetical protein IW262DRAFT_1302065 [Armillaria fumosa]
METPMIISKSLEGAAVETITAGIVAFIVVGLIVLLIICYWQQNSIGRWIESHSHGRQRMRQVEKQQPVPRHYILTNYSQHVGQDLFHTLPVSLPREQQPSLGSLAARPITPETTIPAPVTGPSGTRHTPPSSNTDSYNKSLELDITELTTRAHQIDAPLDGDTGTRQPIPYSEPLIPNSWPGHLLISEGLPIRAGSEAQWRGNLRTTTFNDRTKRIPTPPQTYWSQSRPASFGPLPPTLLMGMDQTESGQYYETRTGPLMSLQALPVFEGYNSNILPETEVHWL